MAALPSDKLLASTIPLPQNPSISYALYRPLPACISPHDSIEHARRSILSRNHISCTILDALLTSVHIGPDPFIYVFNITSQSLDSLHFDDLAVAERSSFSPPSVSLLLPNPDEQNAFSHFCEAVRLRVIDDIVTASTKSLNSRQVKRFKNGFLMSQLSPSDWEYKVITRPLIFCQLQIHFSYLSTGVPSHLVIHPMLLPTPFSDISRSLPLPPGTPIALLPYGTPAFFLACYTGPTTGLTKQFSLSLQGMGAGEWESPSRTLFTENSTFIIGWITVENKQGEDKGITIIYPNSLCLSYIPSSTTRAPLDYIPELPAPLQPSPQAPTVMPSVSALTQSGTPAIANSTGTSTTIHPHRPSFITSPTSESLHSFRTMTLSKSPDFRQLATEVGGYVDAVARERERERERLKKEREGGPLARTTATPASAPTPMAVDMVTASAPVTLTSQMPLPVITGSSQQHLQPSMLVQNFYPSPPQSNPIAVPTISDGKTSPVVDSTISPTVEISTTTTADLAPSLPLVSSTSGSSHGYDPFGPMDTTWTQPAQNYLGMDIDMDFGMDDMGMNFSLNMASVVNSSSSRGAYNDSRGNMEFEDAFTDDDFSFFDRPSRATPAAATTFTQSQVVCSSVSQPLDVNSLPGATMSPPLFADINLSGSGPPAHSHSSSHNQQIWTPGGFMEGFTPRSVDHNDSIPPDLLPSSPGQTPDTHSAPATPNVRLEYHTAIKRPSTSDLFDPIPFAPCHRAADGKYAFGKFALSSPPAEDDPVECLPISLPSSPNGGNSWRFHYDAMTDPRIGVVRKLIGVKRKTTFQQGIRSPHKKSPWVRAHEEWEKYTLEKDDVKSDLESDDDEEDLDDIDTPLISRPTTPAPSYLPLGPTLLHTQFQHSQLLPLCTLLRPPGAAVAPINLIATNTPLSVPTPVSPAATMGQASEKSKSLEAAAFAVAAEAVENPIWAETWRANIVGAKSTPAVWSTDIKAVNELLEAVPSLEAPVDMTSLFALDTSNGSQPLRALETPMISIGKGDAVIHVLPTAVRFWEKLGLGPKGGRKDLSAFVIFEEDGERRQTQMGNWLVSVGNVYRGKHFGSLSPGKSGVCPKDGLVPLRLDLSFRKSLSAFMSSLTPPQPTLIVFLVLPVTLMTLSSPVLRQILSASKKVLSGFTESQIVFEFVPEHFISDSMEKSSPYDSALDLLSSSVYNRILVPVDRAMARRIHEYGGELTRSLFMSPTFTLSRSLCNKVSYVRAARTSLDVMDRYTLLHVAYHLTACGKWILACCVDQRGEAYDLRVWLTQSPGASDSEPEVSDEEYAVRKVWDFAMQFAKKANIEWRVVFARLGVMSEQEMNAWTSHLTDHVLTSREQPPLHHSVVCVEPDAQWLFVPSSKPNAAPLRRSSFPTRSSSFSKHHSVFTDISATTYALFPTNHLTISLPPSHTDLGLSQPFIPEPAFPPLPSSPAPQSATNLITNTVAPGTPVISPPIIIPDKYSPDTCSRPHPITFMPLSTTTLIRVPASPSLASIRMTHIHLLRTFHSYSYTHSSQVSSCPVPDNQQLHKDITKNYYELAVLAKVRSRLDGNSVLPFHLVAVDGMRLSLDRDWDRLEVPE